MHDIVVQQCPLKYLAAFQKYWEIFPSHEGVVREHLADIVD